MSRPEYRMERRPPADADLMPIERDPTTGRRTGFDRDRKNRDHDRRLDQPRNAPPTTPGRQSPARSLGRPRTWAIAGAAAATGAIIISAVLLAGGGSTTPQAAISAPTAVRTSNANGVIGLGTSPGTEEVTAPHSAPIATTRLTHTSALTSTAARPSSPGAVAPPTSATSAAGPTAPAGPAYLNPDRLLGYQEIVTFDVSRMVTVNQDQGSVQRWDLFCGKGSCELVDPDKKFAVGAPRISSRTTDSAGDKSACMPWTKTLDLTLVPTTGIYHGTYTVIPRAEKAGNCSASVRKSSIELVPLIKPDLPPLPADTPAALNPARITGYHGTSTSSGRAHPVTVNCTEGLCVLPCAPLCNGTLHMVAAADTWAPDDMQPDFDACGKGTTTFNLTRSADGGYTGTVTARYAGKVNPKKCPTSMTFILQPTLS